MDGGLEIDGDTDGAGPVCGLGLPEGLILGWLDGAEDTVGGDEVDGDELGTEDVV